MSFRGFIKLMQVTEKKNAEGLEMLLKAGVVKELEAVVGRSWVDAVGGVVGGVL